MIKRRALQVGALVWAAVGYVIALTALRRVNDDAVVLVAATSAAFPLAPGAASLALGRGRDRLAGVLLVASAATPTYFAWVLNIPALAIGFALMMAPTVVVSSAPAPPAQSPARSTT
jgi:hypothetical protein